MFVKFSLVLVMLCVILMAYDLITANLISVDLGSDSMKIAIVQPGSPMEIVANLQSKRKTPTCVAFYKGERQFGSDGYALMGRKPELSLAKFTRLIGRAADHPRSTELKQQYFPYEIYTNETSFATSIKVEDANYTPEELLAMLLQHAKLLAFNHGGKVIKDCVITVPSSFTQHERSALYTAASIADLKILTLIEENTAAALHYGIDRTFDSQHNVLYYNMGATGVQVSVVSYTSYVTKDAGKNKTVGQLEVLGKAWDETAGGFNFDVKLANLLAERFNEQWNKKTSGKGGDVREFYRPMTRLRLESTKIKEVLSANQEFHFKAEQLHADIDLITKITRSEFEAVASDLFDKLTNPIDEALAMANLTLTDINAVELLGGSVRIPKVKKVLDDYFKDVSAEVGQHLNGDEAMALGAAFRAANMSTAFRVRKVGLTDILTFGVSVRLETLPVASSGGKGFFGGLFGGKKTEEIPTEDGGWSKQTNLYPIKSVLSGKSKTLAFQYDQDILCRVEMDDGSHYNHSDDASAAHKAAFNSHHDEGTSSLLALYNITGIADFAKETSSKGLGVPKVHLSFSLDVNGIITLHKAEATVELAPAVNTNTTSDTASMDNATDATATANTTDEASSSNDTTVGGTDSKETKEKAKKGKSKDKKAADSTLRRSLVVTLNPLATIPPTYSEAGIAESRAKLRALDLIDEQRKAKEAALNELEAYIYSVRNKITDDEDKYATVSTQEQRETLVALANEVEDWLYDEGRQAVIASFKAKHEDIKKKAEPIFKRYSESKDRPEAVAKARKQLDNLVKNIDTWNVKMPQVTEDEKTTLLEAINKVRVWLDEKEAAQALISPHETPIFDSSDVIPQMKPVAGIFEKLSKKPKPAVEKVSPVNSTSNDTVTVNVPAADNSTESSDEPPVEVKIQPDTDNVDTQTAAPDDEL